jgi:hypothetical protein
MKKIILGAALLLTGLFAKAQNGLENVIVEKYYVSTAADSVGVAQNGSGVLPAGSVTYRIWADMLPGYNFQALYGVPAHTLLVQTNTVFFNDENFGATVPAASATNVRKYADLIDSYFSVGGAATGKVGVFKSEDTDGSPGNAQGLLQNNDPSATGPINIGTTTSLLAQDGMIAGSPVAVTFVGINNTGNGDLGVFDAGSQVGGLFSTSNGSIAALGGAVGPTAANRILIGQFTTKGTFHFELNIQIGTPSGGVQQYVSSNPVLAEITAPFLTGTFPDPAPVISITAPANGSSFITGASVGITATATDNGSVTQVEFKVDGVSVGIDATSPYSATYAAAVGSHCITAIATDNLGQTTTTACTNITVSANPPPTVSITNPANGASFITGSTVTIDATASDNGSVTQVEFKVDGVSVGIDATSPYSATYTAAVGSHCITATATDNLGATTTTACTNITVANNPPPTVSITAPANGTSFITGSAVNITATAADNGSVTQVEFKVDGVSVGIDAASPYAATYTAGALGSHCITAIATDNLGATTATACTNINVVSTILPYKVVTSNSTCVPPTFCLPIAAVATVSNVIGYDLTLNYNPAKVTPTGNITVYNALVTPGWVDAINSIDNVNGIMNISLFFNGTAPANAQFSGTGNLICVEFTKTGPFNPIDTASFTIPFLQESYFTGVQSQFVDNGQFSTYKDTTFNGSLRFWSDNSALAYDPLNPNTYLVTNIHGNNNTCTSPSAATAQPDLTGNFSYNTANGLNINIDRDILGTTDVQPVINGFDAFLARKVLINDVTFIPTVYQMVGMDVNIDGVISAGDVSQINQRAVLIIPEFRQAWNYNTQGQSNGQLSKDWEFLDTASVQTNAAYAISTTYPLWDGVGFNKAHSPIVPFCLPVPVTNISSCPIITADTYKGVLVGDVNGSFATVGSGGIFRNTNDKVIFDLSHAVIANGYADVPVSILTGEVVNALDFSMQFNQSNLSFASVVDHTDYLQSLANYNADDKTLRFTSNSLQKYELGKSLVSVRFALKNGKIGESDLSQVTGYVNGERVTTEVTGVIGASSVNVNVFPNPASTVLNVVSSEDVTVELSAMDSREVIIEFKVNAYHQQEINTQHLANGVYMMKIFNDNFITMKKVVINK